MLVDVGGSRGDRPDRRKGADVADIVRWGILGAGGIARRFAQSLAAVEDAELVAVAGRDPARLSALARDFEAMQAGSYEELVALEQVDAVYLALPHALHEPYAELALRAGKAVLCEKPAALSAAQALMTATCAQETGGLFVEAMKPRFQPLWERLRALVASGALGELKGIDARIAMTYPEERFDPARGGYFADPVEGGALLDLGTYAASWLDAFTEGDPVVVSAKRDWRGLVDAADDCRLTLGGVPCRLRCSAVGAGAWASENAENANDAEAGAGGAMYADRSDDGVDAADAPDADGTSTDGASASESASADPSPAAGADRAGGPAHAGTAAADPSSAAPANDSVATLAFEQATVEAWPLHRPTHLRFSWANGRTEELEVPYEGDDFTGEIEHMDALVRAGAQESPVMPLAATVRCARILDACASGFDRLGAAIRLGEICGEDAVFLNEPMAERTSFEVGGPADVFCEPGSIVDLEQALGALEELGAPAIVIGRGSDLLVSDAGLRACVLSTERLRTTRIDKGWIPDFGVARVYADAGVGLKDLCELVADAGLGGLEFASGIPGSVGGAVYMNAGAYDGCIADVLESAMVRFPDGRVQVLKTRELGFGYRQSRVRDEGLTVLTATFLLPPVDAGKVRARMDELWAMREAKQPLDVPSAGSTFKRPEGRFAGKLITDAGLKGRRVGGAEVSTKHAGFVVNADGATAQEVHDLIELVIAEVKARFDVTLEPEVRQLGRFA